MSAASSSPMTDPADAGVDADPEDHESDTVRDPETDTVRDPDIDVNPDIDISPDADRHEYHPRPGARLPRRTAQRDARPDRVGPGDHGVPGGAERQPRRPEGVQRPRLETRRDRPGPRAPAVRPAEGRRRRVQRRSPAGARRGRRVGDHRARGHAPRHRPRRPPPRPPVLLDPASRPTSSTTSSPRFTAFRSRSGSKPRCSTPSSVITPKSSR